MVQTFTCTCIYPPLRSLLQRTRAYAISLLSTLYGSVTASFYGTILCALNMPGLGMQYQHCQSGSLLHTLNYFSLAKAYLSSHTLFMYVTCRAGSTLQTTCTARGEGEVGGGGSLPLIQLQPNDQWSRQLSEVQWALKMPARSIIYSNNSGSCRISDSRKRVRS